MARALKRDHQTDEAFVVFNPNTGIGSIAKEEGWSKEEQDKKWIKIFTMALLKAKQKISFGSEVLVMANQECPS
jgi:hypothetical protein